MKVVVVKQLAVINNRSYAQRPKIRGAPIQLREVGSSEATTILRFTNFYEQGYVDNILWTSAQSEHSFE